MSTSPRHEVRRQYRETRREQFRRLLEIVDGGIKLSRGHVIIPAVDFPLLYELLAENEGKLVEEERRAMALEVLDMFAEKFNAERER
jgi:hypothetical protein